VLLEEVAPTVTASGGLSNIGSATALPAGAIGSVAR
jgi:hypothetical protein